MPDDIHHSAEQVEFWSHQISSAVSEAGSVQVLQGVHSIRPFLMCMPFLPR